MCASQYLIQNAKYHVVAIDCGMKQNIVRCLNQKGCNVMVLPWDVSSSVVEDLKPDGIFLSNGPGDPTDVEKVIHLNLLDGTVEGVACKSDQVFCVQYHPESAPGPQDSAYLFEQFIEMMEGTRYGEKN